MEQLGIIYLGSIFFKYLPKVSDYLGPVLSQFSM